MKRLFCVIKKLIDSYFGACVSENKEYVKIKSDILNLRVPTLRDDTENLKKDRFYLYKYMSPKTKQS